MANVGEVTFSSPFNNFAPVVLGPAETLEQTSGIPDETTPVTLRFTGTALRAKLLQLSPHQARRLAGGQPRRNLSGYTDAVADPGAQIVRVRWQEGTERSITGVFTILDATVGTGGHRVQSFSVIIYPCDRLRFFGQPISTAQTRPGI